MKDKDKPLTPKQQAAAVERIKRARAARDALEAMREESPAAHKTRGKDSETGDGEVSIMAKITVKKPTDAETKELQGHPVWSCGVSVFDWHYDSEETALIVEGKVTVDYDGGSVTFGAGDYVVFPQGLSCIWKVAAPVKKHYVFK